MGDSIHFGSTITADKWVRSEANTDTFCPDCGTPIESSMTRCGQCWNKNFHKILDDYIPEEINSN